MINHGRSDEDRVRDTLRRLASDVDCWVATAGADGVPQVVPLSVLWYDALLWLCTRSSTRTVRNLRHQPRARLGHAALDIVGDDAVPSGETRMRHLRITCTDLSVSVPWYEGVGFEVLGQERVTDATVVGLDGPVDAVAARLRLPDEPFEVLLIEWKDPKSHGRHYAEPNHAGIFRAAVGVDDTRAAYEAMSGAGWTFDRAPMLVELKGTPVPDMWICFISDPDGVPFEFVERPRSAFVKS